jgi:isochorismate synthase
MNKEKRLITFINKLTDKNCSFAMWSAPNTDTIELIISREEKSYSDQQINQLNQKSGFIFAPYEISEDTPLIFFKPDIYVSGLNEITGINLDEFETKAKKESFNNHFVVSKKDYFSDIEKTIREIKNTKLSKAIVSRIISKERANEAIGELFVQLNQQTPNAFVYLINSKNAGLWMGATPEILLKSENISMETVSLAGTQQRHEGEYAWFTKDIEEQAFVSRYMVEIFHRFNIFPYTTVGPVTLESGQVAHLSTTFRFDKEKIIGKIGDFIEVLHPTPAVCGFPKANAKAFIHAIEKHDRRYYSGFLGQWQLNNTTGLFVNLRCMEVTEDNFMLYSGGGITARSVPEDEWEETNNKASTLLSAIEAIKNDA